MSPTLSNPTFDWSKKPSTLWQNSTNFYLLFCRKTLDFGRRIRYAVVIVTAQNGREDVRLSRLQRELRLRQCLGAWCTSSTAESMERVLEAGRSKNTPCRSHSLSDDKFKFRVNFVFRPGKRPSKFHSFNVERIIMALSMISKYCALFSAGRDQLVFDFWACA